MKDFWEYYNFPSGFSVEDYKASLEKISHYIPKNPESIIRGLEIGVGWGVSADFMLGKFPNMHLISIDNAPTRPAIKKLKTKYGERHNFLSREDFDKRHIFPILDYLYMDSILDYLYIDGGHLMYEVKQDIEEFVPMVKPGGVLVFDDYDNEKYKSDVKAAVNKYLDFSQFAPPIQNLNETGHLVLVKVKS